MPFVEHGCIEQEVFANEVREELPGLASVDGPFVDDEDRVLGLEAFDLSAVIKDARFVPEFVHLVGVAVFDLFECQHAANFLANLVQGEVRSLDGFDVLEQVESPGADDNVADLVDVKGEGRFFEFFEECAARERDFSSRGGAGGL